MAVNLVANDHGFHADDRSLEAAEVMLHGRRQPAISDVAATRTCASSCERTSPNPWLGYRRRPRALDAAGQRRMENRDGAEPDALPGYVSAAIDLVAGHPDARALALQSGREAAEPFWFPPMLRASLRRVPTIGTVIQRRCRRIVSRTRCLDSAYSGSPWTAWKTLVQLPAAAPATAGHPRRGRSLFFTSARRARESGDRALSAELAGFASLAAPAYYLAAKPQASDEQVAELLLYLVRQAANPEADQASPVVQIGREIMRPGGATTVPLSVSVVRDGSDPLDEVRAEDISATTGVPLPRAERGLQRLRQTQTAERASAAGNRRPAPKASQTDQVVMRVALQHASGRATRSTRLSLEEAIAQLRAAARLIDAAVGEARQSDGRVDVSQARDLAQRLNGVADALLASAGFSVVADFEGRIVFGNGAFRDLLLQGLVSMTLHRPRVSAGANAAATAASKLGRGRWRARRRRHARYPPRFRTR